MFLLFNMENMRWWKLNTPEEWLQFLVIFSTSALVLFAYYRILVRGRSEAAAVDRVHRRFKRRSESGARVYKNVGIRMGDKEIVVDNLLIDTHGILMAHTFGRGLSAYGEPKDEFWRIKDMETNELVVNPLYEVDQMVHTVQTTLAGHDIYGVGIEGAAIFADNFNDPTLYVGRESNAFGVKFIKKFFENRNQTKISVKDPDKVADALETYFFEVPLKENYKQRKTRLKQEKREKRAAAKAAKTEQKA